MSGMLAQVERLRGILGQPLPRRELAQQLAEALRAEGSWRWVGLYDVDQLRGLVINLAWSGPAPPAHLSFSVNQGLTSRAVGLRRCVNVGDVTMDADYLTALDGTRSEIVVPVLDGERVIGTIDVESEFPDAFGPTAQRFLEYCAKALQEFWLRQ